MVADTGKTLRADTAKPVNLPEPLAVEEGPDGLPAFVKLKRRQKITAVAFKLASSGKYPPMTMFWLKCRERWREVQVHEHSGPDGKPIETRANLTDEQLDARIKEMLAKKEPKP